MKVAEVFAKLGFEVDNKALTQFEQNVRNAGQELIKFTAIATASLYALDRVVASSVRGAIALNNFRQQTGKSTEELQKWASAASFANVGLDAESAISSIQNLQKSLIELQLTGSGAAPYARLGINPTDFDAFKVLEQLRGKANKFDPAFFARNLQEMGLDPQFINVLKLSNAEFEKFAKLAYRNKETEAAILRVGTAVKMLKVNFDVWRDNFVAKNEPALMKLVDVLNMIANAFANIMRFMHEIMQSDFGDYFVALAGVMIVAFAPLRAMLAGLLLLLEDLAVYNKGGKSAIGELIKLNPLKKMEEKNQEYEEENNRKPTKNEINRLLGKPIEQDRKLWNVLRKIAKEGSPRKPQSQDNLRDMMDMESPLLNPFNPITYKTDKVIGGSKNTTVNINSTFNGVDAGSPLPQLVPSKAIDELERAGALAEQNRGQRF